MSESEYPGRWWHLLPDGRMQCDLCPRDCRLHEGQRGACFVRRREGSRMVLTTYGRSSGFCIDPIEKKPLNHFHPGTSVLSFGTAGCNLACKFCQNWDISKSREVDTLADAASPDKLARFRAERGLNFTLLSDPSKTTMEKYGAYGEKQLYGKTVVGVIRSTFVIDEKGRIEQAQYNVKAKGHVAKLARELDIT